MIYEIIGTIVATDQHTVTVQPHGSGIGFGIFVPQKELYVAGKEIKLFTYVHWNQEQGPTLYGFRHLLERTLFLLIIRCSGIGPKIAFATLETVTPEEFIQAIYEENIKTISSIPGIGKKKAEQIIVNLKHKIQDLMSMNIHLKDVLSIKHWQQITEVLTSLHYSRKEINQTMHHFRQQDNISTISFDDLLRRALSFLSKLR